LLLLVGRTEIAPFERENARLKQEIAFVNPVQHERQLARSA
jgi:hypothetical protein